ncbi:MAG: DoxX family protein [Devosia sp.]
MTASLILVGRFLLGFYFFQAGIRNFMKMPMHIDILTKKSVPMPRESLIVALAVQVLGGASVALGILPAIGAIGLIGFTIAANVLYHNFWAYSGDERTPHYNSVVTNLAIIGGFLLVIALSW